MVKEKEKEEEERQLGTREEKIPNSTIAFETSLEIMCTIRYL